MRRSPAIAALAIAIALPPAAGAQDGVFVDPDSPTGTEYQLPLETARRQADPKRRRSEKVQPGRQSAPLFGEGIERDSDGAAGGSGNSKASKRGGAKGGGSKASARPAGDPVGATASRTVKAAASRPGTPDGGVGTMLLIGGGAAAILLAGGLGGYLIRRSSRLDPA